MDETESYLTTTGANSILYQAIKNNNLEDVKLLLDDKKININDPIITTGPYAGFTALHLACMENNDDLVKLLVEDYEADVNVMAQDGIQPIHLACFFEPKDHPKTSRYTYKTDALLQANANPNAEFGQETFSKYVKDTEWCPDFGDKMSLVIYSVISCKIEICRNLVRWKANTEIKSLKTNKTLLMYAIDSDQIAIAMELADSMIDPVYINHRDNDGIPAIHYLFHPKKYGDFRYDESQQCRQLATHHRFIIASLFNQDADMYALINDDPETFLPNILVYRSCPGNLMMLLPYYSSIVHSKALYIATLPVDENSDKYLRLDPRFDHDREETLERLQEMREECTEIILKDLVNRLTFGLPVPEGEKQLMDKLIATDTHIKNIVDNYKKEVIEGKLKKKFIKLCDQTMTVYEFIMQVYDDKKLKILSRDEMLYTAWIVYMCDCQNYEDFIYFKAQVERRIKSGRQRFELLEKLKKISQLTEAIPLPYELILDIVEYLPNKDFDNLIKAFVYS